LRPSTRDQGVSALRKRFGGQEFELADLAARFEQAREVVALDVQLDPKPTR